MSEQTTITISNNAAKYLACVLPTLLACAMQYRLIMEVLADGWGWVGIIASQVVALPIGLAMSYFMVLSISSREQSAVVANLKQQISIANSNAERLAQDLTRANLKTEAVLNGKDLAIEIAMKEADVRISELSSQVAYYKSRLQQSDAGNTLPDGWQGCYVRLMELVSMGLVERNGERISVSYAQKNLTKQNFPIEQDRQNGAASMVQVKELQQKGFSVNEKGLLRRHLYTKTGEGTFAPETLAA